MKTETIVSMCGVCPAGCGVNVHLVDGKIERQTPLKGHPLGIICPRGLQAKEVVYSPDRILYPQRRIGPRGANQFERTTWDAAYQNIVEKLHELKETYGPESVAIYTGRGNFEYALNETFAPSKTAESSANAVLFPFGSPNSMGVGSLCYAAYGMIAPLSIFGEPTRNLKEDIDHADLILVWGENPATDSPPINLRHMRYAQKRGARIIVIDHRRSETARATQAEWIGIRPGTDGALALGTLHVLLNEGWYDQTFAQEWTHGLPQLIEYVQQFTPAAVETITGVSAERIHLLAQQIAQAKGCSILMHSGLEYSNSGVQAIRAVWILQALAGHLDVPGGKLFKMPNRPQLNRLLTPPPRNGRSPIGAAEYPLYRAARNEAHAALLPQAILEGKPYPIRALIVSGASLITSWPNPALWRQALAALDLLVVVNRFPIADSAYADFILPATTMFEIESYMIYDGHVQLRQRVIPPRGEARNDYLIFAELAQRLGYGDHWPQTEEGLLKYALKDMEVTIDDLRQHPEGLHFTVPEMQYRKYEKGLLRADGRPGFNTPTGKFEITAEWFRQHNFDPLPIYTEPSEGPISDPDCAARYPLVFNSGARTQSGFRSQHHNIPSLLAKHPHPLVNMHPDDAQKRGIAEGDEVYVISPRGQVSFHAHLTEDIVPGVVEINMGGGGPLGPPAWQIGNVNKLTDFYNRDPLSGFPVYKSLLCDVVKC